MKKYIILSLLFTTSIQPITLLSLFFKKSSKITRAGVGIIVSLNTTAFKNPSLDNYGIIIGHDKNIDRWMIGQAGKIDPGQTIEVAAARELFEETGCYMKVNPEEITKMPFITTHDKKLFFMKSNDLRLTKNIDKSVKTAQNNPKLSSCCKEIDTVEVVKLSTLLELAQQIESKSLDQSQFEKSHFSTHCDYYVTTTTGCKILLDGYYMRMFGNNNDLNAYKNAYKVLQKLITN